MLMDAAEVFTTFKFVTSGLVETMLMDKSPKISALRKLFGVPMDMWSGNMKAYKFTDPSLCDAQVRISIIHQMACKARLAELIEQQKVPDSHMLALFVLIDDEGDQFEVGFGTDYEALRAGTGQP